MLKFIAVATFTLALATSAQAIPRAPLHQPDGMITQIREGCGVGRVRINGACVTRRYGAYGYNRGYGYGTRRYYGAYGYGNRRYYGSYGRLNRPYARGRAYRRWN